MSEETLHVHASPTLELIFRSDDLERVLGLKDDDADQTYERGVLALLD